ncbi:extensin-like domain-containing protein [Rhizobium sp. GN54]|uniref:extensin-like domain-containing protein n=1 Tax=Rhizobium sp. GN54 TaxID=2898150 RepID=UPI001E2ED7FD|nr:extensin family protein [Rhizobium sp. GN54]MCD2184573.1 extensin family protein [Rhizobium sp. GN54]
MSITSAFSPARPAAILAALFLAACSADLTPPASVDGESTVSAIRPAGAQRMRAAASDGSASAAYPAGGAPVSAAGGGSDTFGGLEPVDQAMPAEPGRQPGSLPRIDSDEAMGVSGGTQVASTGGVLQIPQDGVNMDAGLGVGQDGAIQGLAEAQAGEIAEGNATQVVVDGIGSDDPRQLGQPQMSEPMPMPETEAEMTAPAARSGARRAEEEQKVAFIPRFDNPMSVPESRGGMPASEKACRQRLQRLGVKFRDVPAIGKGRSCGIAYPIELQGLSGGIQIRPAAQVNCQITEAFAKWVKNELAPAARLRYVSGVKSIHQMSSYSCRTMNSQRGAAMSEHAKGNAIDVGKIVLNNGKEILIRKKGFFAFREKGLLKAVRSDSCKYFTTVLGPGSDRFHKDHFHFDLRTRKSGYRHCSL